MITGNLAVASINPSSSAASLDRWKAVADRDLAADGRFVFAVTTTGIYCRPTCPSRRPRRDHVQFFDRAADAEQAGFRACLRCKPRDAVSPARARVEKARVWLDSHQDARPTLAGLARVAGLSPWHLQRSFTRLYGVSPRDPVVFAVTGAALLAIALLASWLPARRAAHLNPTIALRAE